MACLWTECAVACVCVCVCVCASQAQQIGQAEIKKRDQIISKLQQELKESEIQARVYQSDLTDKLRNLQHEIISKEEKHTASQYELSNKVGPCSNLSLRVLRRAWTHVRLYHARTR